MKMLEIPNFDSTQQLAEFCNRVSDNLLNKYIRNNDPENLDLAERINNLGIVVVESQIDLIEAKSRLFLIFHNVSQN